MKKSHLAIMIGVPVLCLLAAGAFFLLRPPATDVSSESSSVIPSLPEEIHQAEDGTVVIEPTASASSVSPETVWQNDDTAYHAFTLPDTLMDKDGCIGILTIPKIELSVGIYESNDQMEDMLKGVAHFKSTSAWNGNVGLSAHNDTLDNAAEFFHDLHTLQNGDSVFLETSLGRREYTVTQRKEIAADDWSYLERSDENLLTMITCINGKPDWRLMVQASEKNNRARARSLEF